MISFDKFLHSIFLGIASPISLNRQIIQSSFRSFHFYKANGNFYVSFFIFSLRKLKETPESFKTKAEMMLNDTLFPFDLALVWDPQINIWSNSGIWVRTAPERRWCHSVFLGERLDWRWSNEVARKFASNKCVWTRRRNFASEKNLARGIRFSQRQSSFSFFQRKPVESLSWWRIAVIAVLANGNGGIVQHC